MLKMLPVRNVNELVVLGDPTAAHNRSLSGDVWSEIDKWIEQATEQRPQKNTHNHRHTERLPTQH